MRFWLALLIVFVGGGNAASVVAYDPESPEVVAMVERAIEGLARLEPEDPGAQPLMALPFVKVGKPDHPQVAKAVAYVRQILAGGPDSTALRGPIYSPAVALIFLCQLDKVQYAPEIRLLLQHLYDRQMPGGGWGYASFVTGDTSQSQYGLLALWAAQRAGFEVPSVRVERALGWLLRTQDTGGGFSYQPNDPGPRPRQRQSEVTLGLSAAGTASLYVAAEMNGWGAGDRRASEDGTVPPALRRIDDAEKGRQAAVVSQHVLRAALSQAQAEGNRHFDSAYRVDPGVWQFYYLYTLERFMSLRENVDGSSDSNWYDDGVELLRATQRSDGTWHSPGSGAGAGGDTAFAILFLIRSMGRDLPKPNDGSVVGGGKDLSFDITRVRVRDGKIVGVPQGDSADELLLALEDPEHSDVDAIAELQDGLKLDGEDAEKRRIQLVRLRRLVSAINSKSRITAVRTLGKNGDFDDVPYLIYALTDPSNAVARMAETGLRQISRRLDGVGISLVDLPEKRAAAALAWKRWYKSVNPEAIFIE